MATDKSTGSNEITVTFNFPKPLLGKHWRTYRQAGVDYDDKEYKAGRTPDPMIRRYLGAVAALRDGWVQITGWDSLPSVKELEDYDNLDLNLIGLLVVNIANPIEGDLNNPLADYLSKSSGTTTTANITSNLPG